MSNYRQTSLFAYETVKPVMGEKQQQVLRAIKKLGTCTDQDIASELGWSINRITNRRGELVDQGKVVYIGSFVPPNGRQKVRHYRAI